MRNKPYIAVIMIICMAAMSLAACTKNNENEPGQSDNTIEVSIPAADGSSDESDTKQPELSDDIQPNASETSVTGSADETAYTPFTEWSSTGEDLSRTAHNYQPDEEYVNPYPERVVKITNIREVGLLLGASFQSAYTLIDQYAAEHNIAAENVTMVGYYLDGEFGQRTPIYLKYDDPDETMAMIIFDMTYPEPANAVQIQDSDLTMADVRVQWWYKGEG